MGETYRTARLYLTAATHEKDGAEPFFNTEHLDIPSSLAKGLLKGTHIIVPNWKPFNQEDKSTHPTKNGYYLVYCTVITEHPYVLFWDNRTIIKQEWFDQKVTKYMPIPKG